VRPGLVRVWRVFSAVVLLLVVRWAAGCSRCHVAGFGGGGGVERSASSGVVGVSGRVSSGFRRCRCQSAVMTTSTACSTPGRCMGAM